MNELNAQYTFGKDILGPIFFEYCQRLHLQLYAFQKDAVALFACRGGFRLLHLYNLYLERLNLSSPLVTHQFYISRFLAVKAGTQYALKDIKRLLLREYKNSTVSEFIECLCPGISLDVPEEFTNLQLNGDILDLILTGSMPWTLPIYEHLRQQNLLLHEYLQSLAKNKKTLLLVDTGWTGTTQLLLMQTFPEYTWQGIHFGKWDTWDENPPHFHQINGLIIQNNRYIKSNPETAILDFHHIIEAPLEPDFPSVETLKKGSDNQITPSTHVDLSSIYPQENDHHFRGICDYFLQPPLSLSDSCRSAAKAKRSLCKTIRYPTPGDIEKIRVEDRSIDFGKKGKVSIFNNEKSGRRRKLQSKLKAIERSIWKQGKITLEFPIIYPLIQFLYNNRHHYRRIFPANIFQVNVRPQKNKSN